MDIDDFAFEIKESTIPNAGRGVFAKVHIKKNSIACEYRGKIYKADDLTDDFARENWDKRINLDGDMAIFGYPDNVGACVNDIIDFKKYSKEDLKEVIRSNQLLILPNFKYNCVFVQLGHKVMLFASEDINPGDELFGAYGPTYWKSQMIKKNWL